MRTLGCLLVPVTATLGACLTAPTGVPEGGAWPPPATAVLAVAAGPVDGDAIDDLLVVDATSRTVYLLAGGVDVDPTRAEVTTYSRHATLADLQAPARVLPVTTDGGRFVVVLDNASGGPWLTVLDGDLVQVSRTKIPGGRPVPAAGVVTLARAGFGPPTSGSVFGSLPDQAFFVEDTDLAVASPVIKAVPGAAALTSVRAVGGYRRDPTPRVFVSELDRLQRADAGMGSFTWTVVRPVGSAWTAQAVTDLDGNANPEVVGYQKDAGAAANLCVFDVDQATSACAATQIMASMTTLAVGGIVTAGQHDVAVLDPIGPQGDPALFLVTGLTWDGTTAAIGGGTMPALLTVTEPRLTLAELDGGGGVEMLVVGADGAVACLRPGANPAAAPVGCAR